MDIKYFFEKIKDVKISDCLSVFPMLVARCMTPIYKKKYNSSWLICEEPMEARDNGYHFFRYMCLNHPEQKCYYAIKKNSVDYKKVSEIGEVIEYGSIKHWIAYFLCKYNISSQKGGKPNAALCYFFEMNRIFKPQNVFLQHGVTKDQAKWLYAEKCNFKYFITAAIPEDYMIKKDYGYPENVVQMTGFPRYDALDSSETIKKRVLIMPTWRNWFNLNSKSGDDINKDFTHSDYLKKWLELLNDKKLEKITSEYQLEVIFFLHRNMQRYIESFKNVKNHITLASWENYDIQNLLKTSVCMITDYSSVFFDMIYMEKPIVFYQFDEIEYRKYQYQKGWFDYHNNPFSQSYANKEEVTNKIEEYAKNEFCMDEKYKKACSEVFKFLDKNNSKRVYELLIQGR